MKTTVEFELIDAMPEIQLIDLLMRASQRFDEDLTHDEKDRAVGYFRLWYYDNQGPTKLIQKTNA